MLAPSRKKVIIASNSAIFPPSNNQPNRLLPLRENEKGRWCQLPATAAGGQNRMMHFQQRLIAKEEKRLQALAMYLLLLHTAYVHPRQR